MQSPLGLGFYEETEKKLAVMDAILRLDAFAFKQVG
jgi:hypothetical protein